MTAPDPAFTAQQQLFPPGPRPIDAITLYEGATQAKNGFTPWAAWDLRGPILKMAWDLLRFQLPAKVTPLDPTVPIGLRDSINHILVQTQENNLILRRLAKTGNVDISDITGA
jgi:hypothetical protein